MRRTLTIWRRSSRRQREQASDPHSPDPSLPEGERGGTQPSPSLHAERGPGGEVLPEFRLLIYLFVGLRLILLLAHPPTLAQVDVGGGVLVERGLTEYGDFRYHFGVAYNSRIGLLPYRDFWYEYPPIIPLLSGAVYGVARGDFSAYAALLALMLTAFDTGNLLLVRRIGAHVRGPAAGETAAWLYALVAAPLVLAFWNFEAVVTFWFLLSLALLLEKRGAAAGVAIALGALVKLVPLVVLGVVWRFLAPRTALGLRPLR